MTFTVTGNIFSGSGVWNGTTNAWGTQGSSNWVDGAAPGTFGAPYNNTDTATFSGSGSLAVSLSNANPSLAAISFSNSAYTLSNGTLTLAAGGPGSPVIGVTDTTTQTIASTVAGTQGLLKNGPGTLILSASNNSFGDATVAEGELILNSAGAIADGSSLTVGNASAFSPAPVVPASAASAIPPVPEPGTLVLLAVGLACLAARRWRRKAS
jgi:autotransporter-associated beta strand protein